MVEITENIQTKRKRLIFRAWHRGTREMDLLLGSFADTHVPGFAEDQLAQFDELLRENDPDIYGWYTGREDPGAALKGPVLDLFMAHQFGDPRKDD